MSTPSGTARPHARRPGTRPAQPLRHPSRHEARIRNLISSRDHDTGPTRSHLEDEFLRFIAKYGLPRPEVNQTVAGKEVDMLWRDQRLIVELDSHTYHRDTFEEDREGDAHLLSEGFATLRITSQRLKRAPQREADRLHALLAARRDGEGGIRTLG